MQRVMVSLHEPSWCSGTNGGLWEQDLPPELLQRLTVQELQPWLEELRRTSEERHLSGVSFCLGMLCIFLPGMWCLCCWWIKRSDRRWSSALNDWQQRLNAELLIPRGLYVKTQSYCTSAANYTIEGGSDSRHISRWVAFALTPQEMLILQREPHLSGNVEERESAFMLHP